ncbi:MAG TPA: ferritin-like domain-containing protein [Sphingomonas sp.]|jgi:uncharacterized ferritin-like protein (DUF455 family)|uniref:ferritin-like domain-containing protein n=1 Tax=Sphingomonas sp. TaxID=28214 RepID=UPI002ED8C19A
MPAERSVAAAALAVLSAAHPADKVKAARAAARDWRAGRLVVIWDRTMPDRPARPDRPELLPATRMPRRGRGGSAAGRIAMLHALAHIEFAAIDLAFDLIGRFAMLFPPTFLDDWFGVGADEAMHFALIDRRLRVLGSFYGALPAHDGLWEAAGNTSDDALARLAIVPMVLEARGLDVTPVTIDRFAAGGDATSARILTRIAADEVRHVSAGVRWFLAMCADRGLPPVETWRRLVSERFAGPIKPPFNDSARHAAGLTKGYYTDLPNRPDRAA